MSIKNDMFKQDQEHDSLSDLKQYCKIYDEFIAEIDEKMQKYTQQETVIQQLQVTNQELLRQLDNLEYHREESSDSDQTEMMHLHGDVSSDGRSNFSSARGNPQRNFKSEITSLELVQELKQDENEVSSTSSKSGNDVPTMQDLAGEGKKEQDVPSMQDLIKQAKTADQKAKEAKKMVRRGSRMQIDQRFSGNSNSRNKMSSEFFSGSLDDI